MKPRQLLLTKSIAVLTVIALLQLNVVGVLADVTRAAPQANINGKLTTRGNQPISVNGISVRSGDTITPGSNIVTPNDVGATISLGSLGSVDLAPNTKVELMFNTGLIKVRLIEGCVIVRT